MDDSANEKDVQICTIIKIISTRPRAVNRPQSGHQTRPQYKARRPAYFRVCALVLRIWCQSRDRAEQGEI